MRLCKRLMRSTMPKFYNLYMDDSGTRHPDKKIGRKAKHGNDWFSMGGIIINQDDEDVARELCSAFCAKWDIKHPLHSSEIRAQKDNFAWVSKLKKEVQDEFYEELYCLMKSLPVIGIACVIDRPSYDKRYREKYGRDLWSLCKTAFSISVERSLKYAISKDAKLRVFVERSDKKTDYMILNYYRELKNRGVPFGENSQEYQPLKQTDFMQGLYEFRAKYKSSPLMQIADLYLWVMSIGGYDSVNKPYTRLVNDKKLIDCYLGEKDVVELGIKYSCFDFK